jgi:uncharacterized protein
MELERLLQGKNSVLYNSNFGSILYEKLSNTIHLDKIKKLQELQKKIEHVDYNPLFEADSLKKKKNEKIENLIFNVTESCNFSCSYCIYSNNYRNERAENNSNMDLNIAKKSIDLLINRTKNPLLISFYGGEPLNNMELVQNIIKYIRVSYPKKICAFSMTSNFYNADKYLDRIINDEIHINISFDGPKRIHDKNRKLKNGHSTYNKIIKNLKKFNMIAPEYCKKNLRYNVTCGYPDDLPEIINFFQKNKQFVSARISRIESKGLKRKINSDNDDNNIYSFHLVSNYINSILSGKDPGILRGFFDQGLKRIAFRSRDIIPEQLMLDGCCYPGNRKLFIDTNGTFYICERFGRRVPIGDTKNSINHKLVDNAIEEFKKIRNNLCTNCWGQRICAPCIQSSKDSEKNISEIGLSQTCDLNKSQALVSLIQYVYLSKKGKILENYINSIF